MKSMLSVPVIVALGVVMHTDWHFARRFSRSPWQAASLNAALGAFVGQIVEPILEAAFYDGRLAFEVESERWLAFGQCLAAAGLAMAAAVAFVSGHRKTPNP